VPPLSRVPEIVIPSAGACGTTLQSCRLLSSVLWPESFRGGCSFGTSELVLPTSGRGIVLAERHLTSQEVFGIAPYARDLECSTSAFSPLKTGREWDTCLLTRTLSAQVLPLSLNPSSVPQRSFIRHVVLFSAKDEADVARIRDGLSMLADIPHSSTFEVVQNSRVDSLSGEIDVVVYAEFEDQAAMKAYKDHPIYQKAIDVVRPLRDMRIAADF